jgi:cytochrome c biogenesis protein CcmG/thiol:disulfide interchange protein DsbE
VSDQPATLRVAEPRAEAEGARRSLPLQALKLLALAVIVGLLGLLVWATLASGRGSSLVARVAAGKKPAAPAFNLEVLWPHMQTWPPAVKAALADGNVNLRELRGRPVVLNFWASWCIPCRDEAPILHGGAARHRGQVVFVGVDIRDLTDDALGFARKYKINYVSVHDGGGKTWDSYGLTGVPETYFIDAQGRIVAHIPGAVSGQSLEEGVAAITSASSGGMLEGGAHVVTP